MEKAMHVLTLNSYWSSVKFVLSSMGRDETRLFSGSLEGIESNGIIVHGDAVFIQSHGISPKLLTRLEGADFHRAGLPAHEIKAVQAVSQDVPDTPQIASTPRSIIPCPGKQARSLCLGIWRAKEHDVTVSTESPANTSYRNSREAGARTARERVIIGHLGESATMTEFTAAEAWKPSWS